MTKTWGMTGSENQLRNTAYQNCNSVLLSDSCESVNNFIKLWFSDEPVNVSHLHMNTRFDLVFDKHKHTIVVHTFDTDKELFDRLEKNLMEMMFIANAKAVSEEKKQFEEFFRLSHTYSKDFSEENKRKAKQMFAIDIIKDVFVDCLYRLNTVFVTDVEKIYFLENQSLVETNPKQLYSKMMTFAIDDERFRAINKRYETDEWKFVKELFFETPSYFMKISKTSTCIC